MYLRFLVNYIEVELLAVWPSKYEYNPDTLEEEVQGLRSAGLRV